MDRGAEPVAMPRRAPGSARETRDQKEQECTREPRPRRSRAGPSQCVDFDAEPPPPPDPIAARTAAPAISPSMPRTASPIARSAATPAAFTERAVLAPCRSRGPGADRPKSHAAGNHLSPGIGRFRIPKSDRVREREWLGATFDFGRVEGVAANGIAPHVAPRRRIIGRWRPPPPARSTATASPR